MDDSDFDDLITKVALGEASDFERTRLNQACELDASLMKKAREYLDAAENLECVIRANRATAAADSEGPEIPQHRLDKLMLSVGSASREPSKVVQFVRFCALPVAACFALAIVFEFWIKNDQLGDADSVAVIEPPASNGEGTESVMIGSQGGVTLVGNTIELTDLPLSRKWIYWTGSSAKDLRVSLKSDTTYTTWIWSGAEFPASIDDALGERVGDLVRGASYELILSESSGGRFQSYRFALTDTGTVDIKNP